MLSLNSKKNVLCFSGLEYEDKQGLEVFSIFTSLYIVTIKLIYCEFC